MAENDWIKGLYNNAEAAAYLGLKPTSLRVMRSQGKGPVYKEITGRIYYTKKALDNYINGFDDINPSEGEGDA